MKFRCRRTKFSASSFVGDFNRDRSTSTSVIRTSTIGVPVSQPDRCITGFASTLMRRRGAASFSLFSDFTLRVPPNGCPFETQAVAIEQDRI